MAAVVVDPDGDVAAPTVLRDKAELKKSIRVLVTGATGLLGRQLMEQFEEYSVTGVGWSRVSAESDGRVEPTLAGGSRMLVRCDLRDAGQIEALFNKIDPVLVIHSAAERRPDVVERDEAGTRALNVLSTQTLARLASKKKDCFVLLISTDYVFDGASPPYKASSATHPLNSYGRSKLAAEQALWESGHSGGVLRVPVLYGRTPDLNESAVTCLVPTLLRAAATATPVKVDHWAVRVPTYVGDVAYVCYQLCERRLRHCSLSGTWHFAGPDVMTKYDMAVAMAPLLDVPLQLIVPDADEPQAATPRPKDSRLDTSVTAMMGIGRKTSFVDGIKIVFADHPELPGSQRRQAL